MSETTDQIPDTPISDIDDLKKAIGAIAHDMNDHLTSVMGYSDILQMKLAEDQELHEYAEMASESAEVMSGLTRKLLSVSRRTD